MYSTTMYHHDKFECDLKEKSKIFNNYFAQQCSMINNNSAVLESILYWTDASLTKIVFTTDDIANIIKNLDSNKSHGHDNISMHMLKICIVSICKPLEVIFRICLTLEHSVCVGFFKITIFFISFSNVKWI